MNREIITIGEALIDFIAHQKGVLMKDVEMFERKAGGAPANVAAVAAMLGAKSSLITQLGCDAFGDYILELLKKAGVCTDKIFRTNEANTALAFVSLAADGNRSFSFYRNPCADLLLDEGKIDKSMFDGCGILHFCSVDLVESPMKHAHKKAIKLASESGALISFDPNVRLPLWDDSHKCHEAIHEFLPYADIVKVSDDELEFIFGETDEAAVRDKVLGLGVKMLLITRGAHGAAMYTDRFAVEVGGVDVKVVDTTGAGDAFIGSFLYGLVNAGVTKESADALAQEQYSEILSFANSYAAQTTTKKGAIM